MLDIFLNWQFFLQKNISLSLCCQIAKLKLPMCGQSLKEINWFLLIEQMKTVLFQYWVNSFKTIQKLKNIIFYFKIWIFYQLFIPTEANFRMLAAWPNSLHFFNLGNIFAHVFFHFGPLYQIKIWIITIYKIV